MSLTSLFKASVYKSYVSALVIIIAIHIILYIHESVSRDRDEDMIMTAVSKPSL